ncbi:coiled-coil domain-containing protein 92 isoform X2 [Pimephales promelas]|uniref:coiled-coil domain-containing protein 92 isoform X2 n=2 Tax=Pimephales promelas TaxID=90988 RepID=UPI0019558F3E|nr:coiled-coil domain-containing protein 92 isoform X2 [Pimephales promelas]KAG1970049.1 coiled-coil domain-containing protein [Pimephales promelas]
MVRPIVKKVWLLCIDIFQFNCKKELLPANIWDQSMDRSTLAQQVESVERNVAFLQQEHRILLTGLRLEIHNLKKRCNELSCDLSKRPPVRTQEDIEMEEELLQARLLETEQHLAEQESALVQLRVELRKKGALASALQVRLRDEERRFLDELKRRSHKITTLSRDLRKQTDVAAQLSFQLHSAHFRLYHQAEDFEEDDEEEEDDGGAMQESEWTANSPWTSPVMAENARQSRASGRMRRSERVRECVPRERVLGPEEPRPMPDPALFLYPFRHRLLPLHRSLGDPWSEGGLSRMSVARKGRFRNRPLREDIGPETTEL